MHSESPSASALGMASASSSVVVDRRAFLRAAVAGTLSAPSIASAVAVAFPPMVAADDGPLGKRLDEGWVASLTARGQPLTARGADLQRIGMPVGGIGAGTVYLSGDGRLWHWDIFNRERAGICPSAVPYGDRQLGPTEGASYVTPPLATTGTGAEVGQGFTLRWRQGGAASAARLDAADWSDVTFLGQYPIGTVTYRDGAKPIAVTLEAFSPFVPLDADRSSYPATVFVITLTNTSKEPLRGALDGWLENAVGIDHRSVVALRENLDRSTAARSAILMRAAPWVSERTPIREDIVVEDWTKERFEGWTVEGDAFGAGPIAKSAMPKYQGDVGGPTERVANSHGGAPANEVRARDSFVGTLSRTITAERDFLSLWVGGGHHEKTCVELLRDGALVARVSGRDDNRMSHVAVDLREHAGAALTVRIVDQERGPWGHVGVGELRLTDRPMIVDDLMGMPDIGSLAIACDGDCAVDLAAVVRDRISECKGSSAEREQAMFSERLFGGLSAEFELAPGASTARRFVVAWHFPNLSVGGKGRVGRWYESRHADAAEVAHAVLADLLSLEGSTRRWRDTWYDSTLPYWLLDRAFANTSTLATATVQRWRDGRFWAWEGVGCCAGTCTHVWHYAQAMGRVFPELERDQRERVDYGVAFHEDSGVIRFRAEHNDMFAIDGQAGTILRTYREHLMSRDDAFLRRVWLRVRRSVEAMIERDPKRDGIVVGPLHNTLDADWPGVVPWLVSMYHAGLAAGAAMADRMGDVAFARRCRDLIASGRQNLVAQCFSKRHGYFIHVFDGSHDGTIGVFEGCHIDQVLGQGWCHQVGLERVMDPEHTRAALAAIWKHDYLVDVGPFRAKEKMGRWYAVPGESGTIMASFPFEKPPAFGGPGAWAAMYFNECMSGFEHQVAAHMVWEGMVPEGLAVMRSVHDRYHPSRRNPYNEIECSDHYARAMASYGVYLAACGWEYDGPAGHVGIDPRIGAADFRAAFTAAEGWGTVRQVVEPSGAGTLSLAVVQGQLELETLATALGVGDGAQRGVRVSITATNGATRSVAATRSDDGHRAVARLGERVRIGAGERIEARFG